MAEAPDDDGRLAAMTGRGQRDNYRTGANLARRQALFAHADPSRSSGTPPIERIAWCGDERVLDAGCGNGLWLRTLAERFGVGDVVGVDLSTGMLADARDLAGDAARLVAGDVRRLPFADGTFDAVLCFWTLYHVPDQDAAVRELRRVLRPGGRALVTTNSDLERSHEAVVSAAFAAVTGGPVAWRPLGFSAENGAEILGRAFDRVEPEPVVTRFTVPSPEPLLDVLASMRGPVEVHLGRPVDWPAVEAEVRRRLEAVIASEGAFRTELVSVSYLCS